MNNDFFQKLRCRFGNHVNGHFLLQGDKRCLVEACKHCLVVFRIVKLNKKQLREFNEMRRKSPIPWPELEIPKPELNGAN